MPQIIKAFCCFEDEHKPYVNINYYFDQMYFTTEIILVHCFENLSVSLHPELRDACMRWRRASARAWLLPRPVTRAETRPDRWTVDTRTERWTHLSRCPLHFEGSVSIVRRFDSPKIQLKLKLALTLTLTLTDTGGAVLTIIDTGGNVLTLNRETFGLSNLRTIEQTPFRGLPASAACR